jgi:methyl-accepting chemotaxis protein
MTRGGFSGRPPVVGIVPSDQAPKEIKPATELRKMRDALNKRVAELKPVIAEKGKRLAELQVIANRSEQQNAAMEQLAKDRTKLTAISNVAADKIKELSQQIREAERP